MNDDTMTPGDIAKAENYPALGPAYKAVDVKGSDYEK